MVVYALLANQQRISLCAVDFEAYAAYVPHGSEGVLHCCNALEQASCSSPTAVPNRAGSWRIEEIANRKGAKTLPEQAMG